MSAYHKHPEWELTLWPKWWPQCMTPPPPWDWILYVAYVCTLWVGVAGFLIYLFFH